MQTDIVPYSRERLEELASLLRQHGSLAWVDPNAGALRTMRMPSRMQEVSLEHPSQDER